MTTRITSFVQIEDVVKVVGNEDAVRGWECFEDGNVFDAYQKLHREKNELSLWAMCIDGDLQLHHVRVSLNQGTVLRSGCTCPAGGACKHVAALLYAWIYEPETFEISESWRAEIALWSKEQLLEVIFSVSEQSTEIDALLQREIGEIEDWPHFEVDRLPELVVAAGDAPLLEIPALADELIADGYVEYAVSLVTQRLDTERSGILVDWLIEHYERVLDFANALVWAQRRLDDVPSAAYYATVWSNAQRFGVWDELRPVLLTRLMRINFTEYIRALLLEGRFEESLQAYAVGLQKGKTLPDATLLRLAEIAESIDVERAVELYSEVVGSLIERQTREHYRIAANLLARVEFIYAELGRQREWQLRFGDFIAKYPRRPALIEELERVHLLGIGRS